MIRVLWIGACRGTGLAAAWFEKGVGFKQVGLAPFECERRQEVAGSHRRQIV